MNNDKSPDKIVFDIPGKSIDIASLDRYDPKKHAGLPLRIIILAGNELVSVDIKDFDTMIKIGI